MNSITSPGRTDVRKLFFSVASLLLLPILLLTIPILSPGSLLYGLVAFWCFCAVAILLPYAHTVYRIEGGRLIYRSGLRWGSIPVDRIWRITRGSAFLASNASAASTGLRIQFFTGEAFIAPRQEAAFIAELLRINPNIVVKDTKQ
jgi:hypothetical protein